MIILNCLKCINFIGKEKGNIMPFCKAFPKGIPEIILVGKNKHSKPLPDQKNEIVFEKVK